MRKIKINNLKVHANHGCMNEETLIGGDYLINISLEYDFSLCAQTDNLEDTVDYVRIANLAKEEMKITKKLIETVVEKIVEKIKHVSEKINFISVSIQKINPPIDNNVESIEIIREYRK